MREALLVEKSLMKAGGRETRPFLGVQFDCCGVYAPIYRTAKGDAYAGHCPRCLRPIRVRIEAGGSDQRFFRVR